MNTSSSTQFGLPLSKCAIALLCCAFSIEPLFAQQIDWPYDGADIYNSGFADIDQINPSNVAQLKPACTFHTGVNDPLRLGGLAEICVGAVVYRDRIEDDPCVPAQVDIGRRVGVSKLSTAVRRIGLQLRCRVCAGAPDRDAADGQQQYRTH